MKIKTGLLSFLLGNLTLLSIAQSLSYDIRLNQVGFLPNARKLAAVINAEADSFRIVTSDLNTIVFRGECLPVAHYAASDENVRIADFSLFQTPGEYVIQVNDLGYSVPFSIDDNVLLSLSKASIKYFYYNRASMPILAEYAGVYAREMGHPDTAVVVHPSAASDARPAGTVISTPGGWYDAGDYNKYIVNSGISTFTLLSAYETYPGYFDTLDLHIPESNNDIPDILDEALWNIRWMMSMQDTNDGGVYHKTTEASFSSSVMPSQVTSTRYVCAKGTAATLDFAAIMAMTARIYHPYDSILAERALEQALDAWQWAQENPDVEFTNPSASGDYPSIGTGEYGDNFFGDEFSWCAAELYITTGDSAYYGEINLDQIYDLPGWGAVRTLGLLSLVVNKDSLTTEADTVLARTKLIKLADNAVSNIVTSPYRIPGDYYYWGGNNAFANWGMLLMQAFRLSGNASYFNAAISTLDYLMGKNATTYCFVTGTGTKSPMHPHHRLSKADGVAAPVPGMLVGGPNTTKLEDCGSTAYPSTLPAKAYLDDGCSYSTNEVAINWNAPLAFSVAALQCEYLDHFTHSIPVYFSVSTKSISLPAKAGFQQAVVIEGNIDWTLSPSDDWISISSSGGSGSAVVQVSSTSNNTTESQREGMIYINVQQKLVDSITVVQNGIRKTFSIEAEDYAEMSGLQTETTTDLGGGLNLGYVDEGDWVTYNIDISYSGVYDVTIRHAGWAGNFDVSIDDEYQRTITFDATSGWQDWASYTTQLSLTEGAHVLRLDFNSAGTNLNRYTFEWVRELSVNHSENPAGVRIYPVPANQIVTVDFGTSQEDARIKLFTLEGKLVFQKACHASSRENIDVSTIHMGTYILKIISDTAVFTHKLIIE